MPVRGGGPRPSRQHAPRTPRPGPAQGVTLMAPMSAWELLRETLTWVLSLKVRFLKQTEHTKLRNYVQRTIKGTSSNE